MKNVFLYKKCIFCMKNVFLSTGPRAAEAQKGLGVALGATGCPCDPFGRLSPRARGRAHPSLLSSARREKRREEITIPHFSSSNPGYTTHLGQTSEASKASTSQAQARTRAHERHSTAPTRHMEQRMINDCVRVGKQRRRRLSVHHDSPTSLRGINDRVRVGKQRRHWLSMHHDSPRVRG